MSEITKCPECAGNYVYFDGSHLFVCPECGFEFTQAEYDKAQEAKEAAKEAAIVKDANGNPIEDGIDMIITQDIKVDKGQTIKQGSKAKNVRVLDVPVRGHELECTVDGFGRIYIYAKFVKK